MPNDLGPDFCNIEDPIHAHKMQLIFEEFYDLIFGHESYSNILTLSLLILLFLPIIHYSLMVSPMLRQPPSSIGVQMLKFTTIPYIMSIVSSPQGEAHCHISTL